MATDLSADTQRLIAEELQAGGFHNADEVVRAALLSLAERRSVVAALDEALDDMAAGRIQTREEFDREFRLRNGIPNDA